ncbi:hypothetical protein EV132_108199 [Rhizobium sullae]|uniref:Uncharacterized protein n=1 Tax=Rhizobium sullae TaxID=50338 RepID=A0A4R3Q2E5_RHISU|nr:hypothetical protein EV132_108199 [Rhizobium sullae]
MKLYQSPATCSLDPPIVVRETLGVEGVVMTESEGATP